MQRADLAAGDWVTRRRALNPQAGKAPAGDAADSVFSDRHQIASPRKPGFKI
jgi:hypothetical protein